ncbi:MAG: hypothetical protein LBC78_02730 [Oscillospiraceae bacterium]|jgi:hypothetical protein|nr:hypothetical protein [Oscillospiraceae bacterium]
MSIFKRREKDMSPKKRATKAQTNILSRIIGSGILVYFCVTLFRTPETFDAWWSIAVAVFMGVAAAAIIALTVTELIQNYRRGFYKESFYADLAAAQQPRENDAPPAELSAADGEKSGEEE